MSLRINNNPMSVNGINNLQKNSMMVGKSMEKLSSGLRINRAADDAAGLVISEQMRAQITGLSTAISNSETAVNMVQTAEGALDEMNTVLNKARSLALQAANEGANDTPQLVANQSELDNIISSITRIAENTQFGTKRVLDGSLSTSQINNTQAVSSFNISGPVKAQDYAVEVTASGARATFSAVALSNGDAALLTNATTGGAVSAASTFDLETTLTLAGVEGGEITIAAGTTVGAGLSAINNRLAQLDAGVSVTLGASGEFQIHAEDVGTYANGYSFRMSNSATSGAVTTSSMDVAGVNVEATINGLEVTNMGAATAANMTLTLEQTNRGTAFFGSVPINSQELNANITLTESAATSDAAVYTNAIGIGSGATFQIGANQNQTASVTIDNMRADELGRSAISGSSLNSLATGNWLLNGRAQDAIAVIDAAIDDVTSQRGALGAFQSNTLESNINSLKVTRENLTSAESTIRDVDFAVESANFTKLQIMVQSSTAMLAQANQLPQNVLQLLG